MSRIRVAALAVMLGMMVSAKAEAQRYRFDFGVNGGYSWFSKMLDEDETGISNFDVKYKSGWLTGAQATWWVIPWLGVRANGTYAERDIKFDFDDFDNDIIDGDIIDGDGILDDFGDVNLWSGTGDLMFRFKKPREEWRGMEFLPYLALGAGVKWQNPGGDAFTIIDPVENKEWTGLPFTTGLTADSTNTFFLSESNSFLGLVGLGGDVRFHPNWAVRLEVGDRIWKPKIQRVIPIEGTDNTFLALNSDDNVSKTVHELYGQAGLHVLFGLQRPPEVAVVAPPPSGPPGRLAGVAASWLRIEASAAWPATICCWSESSSARADAMRCEIGPSPGRIVA